MAGRMPAKSFSHWANSALVVKARRSLPRPGVLYWMVGSGKRAATAALYGGVSESSLRLTMTGVGATGVATGSATRAGAPKGCGAGFAAVRGSGAGAWACGADEGFAGQGGSGVLLHAPRSVAAPSSAAMTLSRLALRRWGALVTGCWLRAGEGSRKVMVQGPLWALVSSWFCGCYLLALGAPSLRVFTILCSSIQL